MLPDEHVQVRSEHRLSKKYVLRVSSFYFCPFNSIIQRQLISHVVKCQTGDATLDCHLNANSQCFQFKIYLKNAVYPARASHTRYTTCVFSWKKKKKSYPKHCNVPQNLWFCGYVATGDLFWSQCSHVALSSPLQHIQIDISNAACWAKLSPPGSNELILSDG